MEYAERQRLLMTAKSVVHHTARDYVGRGMDRVDLVQEGWIGAMDSLRKFDPGRGLRFTTFCQKRVRGSIIDAIRRFGMNAVTIKRPSYDRGIRLNRVQIATESRFDRDDAEVGVVLHSGEPSPHDVIVRMEEVDEVLRRARIIDRRLPGMLVMLFGLDGKPARTQRAIGAEYGLSETRVAQIISGFRRGMRGEGKHRAA